MNNAHVQHEGARDLANLTENLKKVLLELDLDETHNLRADKVLKSLPKSLLRFLSLTSKIVNLPNLPEKFSLQKLEKV